MQNKTATYQQLQQILVKQGCPICTLSEDAVVTFLDTLLWESSNDLNLHAILVASLGFCGGHSRQLLTFGGQRLAAAVVERAALLASLRRLPELATPTDRPRPAWWRWGQRWTRDRVQLSRRGLPAGIEPCPACLRQFTEEARGIEVLLAHMDEFAAPLYQAGGLCLPHFVQATRAADGSTRDSLLAMQQQVWADLAEHLEEFIRKQMEHHHADPISDEGRLALERTIAALTGEHPVH